MAVGYPVKKSNTVKKSYFESLTLSESDFYNKTLDELQNERIPTAIMSVIVLKFLNSSMEIDKVELNNILSEIKIMMDLFIKSDKSFMDLESLANMLLDT